MSIIKVRIGTSDNKSGLLRATFTQAELKRFGIDSDVKIIPTPRVLEQSTAVDTERHIVRAMEDYLLQGEIDVAVYAMEHLPVKLPESLAITAVSQRQDPTDLLLIRREAYDVHSLFKIKNRGIVGAASVLQQMQLADYRPDVQFYADFSDTESRLKQLDLGDIDAIFLSAMDYNGLTLAIQGVEIVVLNPREFVPAPARGVTVWQTNRQDVATRQLFRPLHRNEVSVCTNIERRVLQLMEDLEHYPAVYSERDGNGNFHTFAACEIGGIVERAHLSSSTHLGVAQKIVNKLLGN
jgi:hydroxymethylbilane synthase